MTELSNEAESKMKEFSAKLALEHPSKTLSILGIPGAYKKLPDDVRNKFAEELNNNPDAMTAKAHAAVAKNPDILDTIANNPAMLPEIMGIKVGGQENNPLAHAAETRPEPKVQVSETRQPKPIPQAKAENPTRQEEKSPAADKSAIAGLAAAENTKSASPLETLSKAQGFDGFIERVNNNPHLKDAFSQIMASTGDAPGNGEKILKKLENHVQKDPEFFNKINKVIDDHPQTASDFARDVVKNPEGAFANLDQGMAMQDTMDKIGNFFTGSGAGNMLGGIGQHIGGIISALMAVFEKFMPQLSNLLGGFMDKMGGSLNDFSASPRHVVTNDPEGKTVLAHTLDAGNNAKPVQVVYDGTTGQEVKPPTVTPEPKLGIAPNTPVTNRPTLEI